MENVMVWTMAKVGTSSYCQLLRGAGISFWNAHWLTAEEFPEAEFPTTARAAAEKFLSGDIPDMTIITGVRDPVARSISALMQQRGRYGNPTTYDALFETLTQSFNISYADKWFERELYGGFGFDVYQHPFDCTRGYEIYDHERHKVAIIRLEDADEVFPEVTERLFGKRLNMINRNSWAYRLRSHPILSHYERLKGSSMPRDFLDKCYNLKYAQHFYTTNELNEFRRRWENGINTS